MLKYLSLESIGLYAVALKLASVFALFGVAFRMAWEPFVYNQLNNNDHKRTLVRVYKLVLLFSTVLVICITIFSREILTVLTTEEYVSAYALTGFLCMHVMLTIYRSIIEIGTKIRKQTYYCTIASTVGMAVNFVLLMILVPKYGILGAPVSLCFGGLVAFGLSWHFSNRVYPVDYPKIMTVGMLTFLFLISIISTQIDMKTITKLMLFATMLLSFGFIYRETLVRTIPMLAQFLPNSRIKQ
jgi:O-antigen/teichoic acid export membrane protein